MLKLLGIQQQIAQGGDEMAGRLFPWQWFPTINS